MVRPWSDGTSRLVKHRTRIVPYNPQDTTSRTGSGSYPTTHRTAHQGQDPDRTHSRMVRPWSDGTSRLVKHRTRIVPYNPQDTTSRTGSGSYPTTHRTPHQGQDPDCTLQPTGHHIKDRIRIVPYNPQDTTSRTCPVYSSPPSWHSGRMLCRRYAADNHTARDIPNCDLFELSKSPWPPDKNIPAY